MGRTAYTGVLFGSVILAMSAGCRGKSGKKPAKTTSSASATRPAASSAPAASSGATPPPAAKGPAPVVASIAKWEPAEKNKKCHFKGRDLEPNLAYGRLAIGARKKEFAVTWHYNKRVPGEGLVAIAGYNSRGQPAAVAHGLGTGKLHSTRIFPQGDRWLVTWFDSRGLVFTYATWKPTLHDLSRVGAVGIDQADDTAISKSSSGALLAAAPLAAAGKSAQLGLFLFAPPKEEGPPVQAIGATRSAHRPHRPAVVERKAGYLVAWEDTPPGAKASQVVASKINKNGREIGRARLLSGTSAGAHQPALLGLDKGALVAWSEGKGAQAKVFVRAIADDGTPSAPAYQVSGGQRPTLVRTGKSTAALVFVRNGKDKVKPHAAAVAIGADGKPGKAGVLLSDLGSSKGIAVYPPAAGITRDGKLAVGFVYAVDMRGRLALVSMKDCLN